MKLRVEALPIELPDQLGRGQVIVVGVRVLLSDQMNGTGRVTTRYNHMDG